ncbi:MAG: hypothetical protein ABIN89_15790 [Chitinophagaceae bacterium]
MNRYLLTILIILLFAVRPFCQVIGNYHKDSIDLRNIREMQINLDTSLRSAETPSLPVNIIRVADVRFDTTYIGLYTSFTNIVYPIIRNYKISFKGGARQNIEVYLNNYFGKKFGDDNNEVVIFLKKLKIIKRDTITANASIKNIGQINLETEVFLKSGKIFYAAFKIDTAFVERLAINKNEISDEMKENLLMPALRFLQNKISSTDWGKVLLKKPFEESAVHENYYNNRFNLPILTQPYKRGVYKTFSEFINNSPAIPDFTIKRDKARTVSLIDKTGNYINTLQIFGFNDGGQCWIQRGNYCFPLIRTGNSFSFFISFGLNLKLLYTVDMEKGDLH